MTTSKMPITEFSMPGMTPGLSKKAVTDGYQVRHYKADLDDLSACATLEGIETRGLAGTEIVILEKDKFVFMDKYFIILTYLEKQ